MGVTSPIDRLTGPTEDVTPLEVSVVVTMARPEDGSPSVLPSTPITEPVDLPDCFDVSSRCFAEYDMIVSIDTEYVHRPERGENAILSYQFTAIFRNGGQDLYAEDVVFTAGERFDDRKTLADLMGAVFRRFGVGYRRAKSMRVLMLSHYGVAEWAALKDRHEIATSLTNVRGVPVSMKPVKVSVRLGHSNYAPFDVYMRDTILVAPTSKRSLKDLSTITRNKKLELAEGEIAAMDRLLAEDRERFIAYAINDCRVAMEYYLRFMREYQDLFGTDAHPVTLGDAAVRAYRRWLEVHPTMSLEQVFGFENREVLDDKGRERTIQAKKDSRRFTETLAATSYLGGMNIAYVTGERASPDQTILDIDFSGAYPAALAALPVIDWSQQAQPLTHTGHVTAYHVATGGLGVQSGSVGISFLHVRFAFPRDCLYPCLPVPSKYGLLFPLEGVTTCTGIEVASALQMGAKVEILRGEWLPPLVGAMHKPVLAFAGFLADITQRRAKEAKDSLRNLMLKEIANSFYGKLAQGIDERNVYNLLGVSERLRASSITTPHYAAMCTGIVRAALGAVVAEVARHPGCEVLSATTDGCMIAIPRRLDLAVDKDGKVIVPTVAQAIPDLYALLKAHYPVMALEQGRLNMGLEPDTWLEVKHAGDRALTLRTRGNVLYHKGVPQHVARAGHKVVSADELLEIHENPDIVTRDVPTLASIRDIQDRTHRDLVPVTIQRKANTDYDFKRIPLLDGSGRTRPPLTVDEVLTARVAAKNIRSAGRRATPEAVALARNGVRLHGGPEAAVRRVVHRAIAQGMGGWRQTGLTDRQIAAALGVTEDDFRNQKRRKFEPQSLPDSPEVRDLVRAEARKLGRLMVSDGMWAVLLSNGGTGATRA